jgi:hypothetical protein
VNLSTIRIGRKGLRYNQLVLDYNGNFSTENGIRYAELASVLRYLDGQ